MKKITEYIKKNKKLSVGVLIIAVLIILIIAVLSINNVGIGDGKATTISSTDSVIKEYTTMSQQEFSRETIETFTSYITTGNSGLYTIEGKNYVILTTGGQSATDIEYKAESTTDGKLHVYYKLSDIPDGENKLRYRILEVTSSEVVVSEGSGVESNKGNGFKQILIFKYNEEKKVYSVAERKLITADTWETDGAYLGTFSNGELTSCEPIDSIKVEDCIIKEKIVQSKNLYTVEIPSKDLIQVYIADKNIEIGSAVTLKLKYEATLQGLSGERVEGYYVEER